MWNIYKMNKNLYLKIYSDKSWELLNNNSLELCSKSHKQYLNVFKEVTKDFSFKRPLNILIIGGGDNQIYNYLKTKINLETSVTIIDPLVGEFSEYEHLYTDLYVKHIVQEPIEIKSLFSEAYPSISNSKYDMIIVDCSEEIVGDTDEIYCVEFIEQLKNLSTIDTDLFMYVPPKLNNHRFADAVHKYFSTDYADAYISAWNETCTYLKLKLYNNTPVYKEHVHFHSNFIFHEDENQHLLNVNHDFMYDYIYNIVSKYCTIMKGESFPFDTGGFSGSFILGESHFNWHSYPESNLLTLDLYHCKYNENLVNLFVELRENFSTESLKSTTLSSNIFNPLSLNNELENISYYNLDI